MSHHPDAAQVIGTAAVLLILGVIALYLVMVPYTHVIYQQDGSEAEAEAAIHSTPISQVASSYLSVLGFPLVTAVRAAAPTSVLAFPAYLLNLVLVAYVFRWVLHAAFYRLKSARGARSV